MLDKEFYIKNGLIYGVVNMVYLMITYVMGVDTMISYWNSGASILIGLGMMVYMGIQVRNANGGFMTLGEGFKSILVIYALGAFLYLLFNFVLGQVIDPELPGKLAEATINKTIAMMENFDLPEDQLDTIYDEMETKVQDQMASMYTITGFIQTYLMTVAFGAIGALIGAAITKKANPNPFEEEAI
tara:strand:+ start:309 stop:866 length:558 start_codon:yes stop_codon:yes gene_type:complete